MISPMTIRSTARAPRSRASASCSRTARASSTAVGHRHVGATLRVYIERYEPDASRHDIEEQQALADLIASRARLPRDRAAHRPCGAHGDHLSGQATALPFPLGVTPGEDGANVAVVSRHATRILVSMFEGETELARIRSRRGWVTCTTVSCRALPRACTMVCAPKGHGRLNRAIASTLQSCCSIPTPRVSPGLPASRGPDAVRRGDLGAVPKAIAGHCAADALPLPPGRPQFIYEVPSRPSRICTPRYRRRNAATVAALAEPAVVAHLKRLGADTVELMPLTAWIDERHLPPLGLSNAWGYNPVSMLAPDPRLAPGGLGEIRAAVDALHAAGLRLSSTWC